jgi:DNA-binding transcriptional regulator YiaG
MEHEGSMRGAAIKRPLRPTAPAQRVTAAGIRFLRERLELSRAAFAEALQLGETSGKTSVFRWEHGLTIPSAEAQQRVAALAESRGVKL